MASSTIGNCQAPGGGAPGPPEASSQMWDRGEIFATIGGSSKVFERSGGKPSQVRSSNIIQMRIAPSFAVAIAINVVIFVLPVFT